MNFILIICQIIFFLKVIKDFFKNPYDFSSIFCLMYFVFYAFPAWDFYYNWGLFGDEILGYTIIVKESEVMFLNFISFFIICSFYVGYKVNIKKDDKFHKNSKYLIKYINYKIVRNSLFIVLSLILIKAIIDYGGNIGLFFSMARKDGVYSSEYNRLLSSYLPLVLFILKIQKDVKIYGYIKSNVIFNIILIILVSISLGQRRTIVNNIIFIFISLIIYNRKNINWGKFVKKSRKKIIFLGIMVVMLVPILWWARNYSTQIQRGDIITLMPWERRGGVELIFGSSSTGFKTFILMNSYKEVFNLKYMYPLYFLICSPIPRGIFESKPIMLVELIQNSLNLKGNPSTFYINEMYMTFGIFSIIFSFIFGNILSKIYKKIYYKDDIFNQIYGVIIISNILTLFKNGYIQFFIASVTFSLLYTVFRKIIFVKIRE